MRGIWILGILGIALLWPAVSQAHQLLLVHAGRDALAEALLAACREHRGVTMLEYPVPRGVRYGAGLLAEDVRDAARRFRIPWVVTLGPNDGRGLKARATVLLLRSVLPPSKKVLRLTVPVEASLEAFLARFPRLRRVGVLLSGPPEAEMLADLAVLRKRLGVSMVWITVTQAAGLGPALQQRRGQVDALWLLPDPLLDRPLVMRALVALSLQYRLPLVAASPLLPQEGTVLATRVDTAAACRLLASRVYGEGPEKEIELPVRIEENPRMEALLGLRSSERGSR